MDERLSPFVANKLNLPLYMLSRLKLQQPPNQQQLKQYIKNNTGLYISSDTEESTPYSNRQNLDTSSCHGKKSCKSSYNTSIKSLERSVTNEKPWHLAPNRYNLSPRPFQDQAGLSGAYWRKLSQTKSRNLHKNTISENSFDAASDKEKSQSQNKVGISLLQSNARKRRPSTRFMILNPLLAYRDPNEPGPATYTPKPLTREYKISKSSRPPQPHIFYRNSNVPLKKNPIHKSHTSFQPGPGRYETRYRNICACSKHLKYQPELDLLIERQKRLKFRNKPYNKIKDQLYCSPDWRHVEGGGFQRLFRKTKAYQTKPVTAIDEAKNKAKQLKLYHDEKYRQMICNPQRDCISMRQAGMPELPIHIGCNRLIKYTYRKQLQVNRKIAFNSGLERWPNDDHSAPLTAQQLKALLDKLPEERRIRDFPIMTKKEQEIISKLQQIPEHMLTNYKPKLRKPLFKFPPLPDAKILTKLEDIRQEQTTDSGYYFRPLNEKLFFKDSSKVDLK